MKKTAIAASVLVLLMTIGVSVSAQESAEGKPQAREEWVDVELTASVVAIDLEKREVTLKGPEGNLLTVVAGEEIKRLEEVKVGDLIEVKYLTFLRAEFREPTAEEKANPLEILVGAGRAPEDVAPAGEIGAVVKALVEVVAIDRETARVTIQTPRDRFLVLPVKDKAVLEHLKVGEIVVMHYAEAVAASLRKVEPKPELPEGE